MLPKNRFIKFRYAAIRRYGEKRWTATDGYIEFNSNYTVGISTYEREIIGGNGDCPYILELSNGTRFLIFLHDFTPSEFEEILSEEGEEANSEATEESYREVAENIQILNRHQ